MRRQTKGYQNQSAAASKPALEPVPCPAHPVFANPEEKRAYEDALESVERMPGEDVNDWLARIVAQARGRALQPLLPLREPGQEG